jgi:hypothetical protein
MSMLTPYEAAKAVHRIYIPPFRFPDWVLDLNLWQTFQFADARVFYHQEDSYNNVLAMVKGREPCNIGMHPLFNIKEMESTFGYSKGAYGRSTPENLMPNIGVYCKATINLDGTFKQAHVLNLVGMAFDSYLQPDYQYFKDRPKSDVVNKYNQMWKLALKAATTIPGIKTLKIYNVGGGAFAGYLESSFIKDIFEPAFKPLLQNFEQNGIQVEGYDWLNSNFCGGYIPDCLYEDDLESTLYINAWDPWSLIGNGNERDASLDGHWGRISNMAVLGWWQTNPHMQFISV